MAEISIRLDPERQIIRVRMQGDMSEAEARSLEELTAAEAQKLADKEDVRVLVDGRELGRADAGARQVIIQNLKRRNLKRYAMWGVPVPVRIFMNVYFRTAGVANVRFFSSEAEALSWLTLKEG